MGVAAEYLATYALFWDSSSFVFSRLIVTVAVWLQNSIRLHVGKSSKGQILRALENFKGPFDTRTWLRGYVAT